MKHFFSHETLMLTLRPYRGILLILASATAIFLASLNNGFVQDDWFLMVHNDAYRTVDIKTIFLSKANSLEYLPIRDLTLLMDFKLWGMEPFGFHLTNLLLYLAGLVVVFKTARILAGLAGEERGEFIAFWTTLIFALHPLHVEVVHYIAARNNLLASLFLFLSFNLCLGGIKAKKNSLIAISGFLFAAALFSKASVVFYPFFLAVVFFFVPKSELSLRRKALIVSVLILIDVVAAWAHFLNASETGMINESFIRFGIDNKALLFARALQIPFFYLKKLVLPYPLSVLYSTSFLSGDLLLRTLMAGIALAAIVAAALAWRKRYPLIVLGTAWLFLSLGPVLNIFPTEPVVADRYAYFAVFGFGLVLACLLKMLCAKRSALIAVAIGLMAAWGVMDISRGMDWKDDLLLWQSALSADLEMTRIGLANALWERGRYEDALAHLKEEYDKNRTFRYNQFLGAYLSLSGRYDDAIAFFLKALSEGGESSKDLHIAMAMAYEKTGRGSQALEHYLRAMEIKDMDILGRIERSAREGAERVRASFIPQLEELRLRAADEPKNFEAQAKLALFLQRLGLYREAEVFYLKSLELDPAVWEAWYNLGLTYMKLGRYGEAIRSLESSLLRNRKNRDVLNNLGICYMSLRNYGRAAQYYREALDVDPNFFYATFNLGRLYFITGDVQNARKYFLMARMLAKEDISMQAAIDRYLNQIQ